jgi:hypothetical protein
MKHVILPAAMVGLLISAANAATVYDESVDGDASQSQFSPTLVSLSNGANIIRGTRETIGRFDPATTTAYFENDEFRLHIPENHYLKSLSLTADILSHEGNLDTGGTQTWRLNSHPSGDRLSIFDVVGGKNALGELHIRATNYTFSEWDQTSLLGPGTYELRGAGGAVSHYAAILTSYEFTANVIPIPSAVWLFGSALAGLGWIRRRSQA